MPNETPLQALLRIAQQSRGGSPALERAGQAVRADEMVNNIVRMRGLGPDSPIGWGDFSLGALDAQPGSMGAGMGVPAAYAGGETPGQPSLSDFIQRLIMLGWNPEKEFSPNNGKRP